MRRSHKTLDEVKDSKFINTFIEKHLVNYGEKNHQNM